jgi:hypothetical protein
VMGTLCMRCNQDAVSGRSGGVSHAHASSRTAQGVTTLMAVHASSCTESRYELSQGVINLHFILVRACSQRRCQLACRSKGQITHHCPSGTHACQIYKNRANTLLGVSSGLGYGPIGLWSSPFSGVEHVVEPADSLCPKSWKRGQCQPGELATAKDLRARHGRSASRCSICCCAAAAV